MRGLRGSSNAPVILIAEDNPRGHRLMYVRVLAQDAVDRGANVHLALAPGLTDSAAFEVHLKKIADRLTVTEEMPSLAGLEDLSERIGAHITVVPDGDSLLSCLLSRFGWHGHGDLHLLIMRAPGLRPSRFAAKSGLKITAMLICSLQPRIRIVQLVTPFESRKRRGPISAANDPAEIHGSPGDVSRLIDEWGLDADRYWYLIAGSITERKNVDLVLDAMLGTPGLSTTGVVIAGSVTHSVKRQIADRRVMLNQHGISIRVIDRVLSDEELDGVILACDCVVVAHSNEGPSGILAKAALAGTRIIAAGAKSLKAECDRMPNNSHWVPLNHSDLAATILQCSRSPRPKPIVPASTMQFARALL